MPLRHSFRRRALSNGLADEGSSGMNRLLSHTPSPAPPLPFFSTGHNRVRRGNSTQVVTNSHHYHNATHYDDYAPGSSKADAQEDDTLNEVYASIWRQSLFDDEHLTPPSSPSRFIFAQGNATSNRSGFAKIRQRSLKKCFTSPAFPTDVISSLLRWRGKKAKKSSNNTLGSTSFLDFSTSQDELPLPSTVPRRAFSSLLMTPPRRRVASGSNTMAAVSPLPYQSTQSSASSSLLCTPDSFPSSCFAASESSLPRPCAVNSGSSTPPPPLSSSSLLINSYSHSPLEATRSFEKLRGSLAWKKCTPSASRRAHPPSTSNRSRIRNGLPPLSPPPSEQLPPTPLPPTPAPPHQGLPQSSDSLQPTLLQWERELKDLSLTLHVESLRERSARLRVNKAIERSLDLDHSTPSSTVTPSILTPRVEAFEFDLDDGPSSSTASPLPRLSPVPVQTLTSTSASAPPTADSSFSQAMQSFPSPPLRCRSSSGGPDLVDYSSARYYSADSDIDPLSHFSISSSNESIGRLTFSSSHHHHRHIDSITLSSQSTTAQSHSLYTLACDQSSDI